MNTRLFALAVWAAAGVAVLASCSGSDSATDSIVDPAPTSVAAEVDVQSEGQPESDVEPAPRAEPEAAGQTFELPTDLPAEIPVIDGEVVATTGEANDDGTPGWTFTVAVDGADSWDTIVEDFVAAGFEEFVLFDDEFGANGTFSNDDWLISVNVAEDGRAATGWSAGYAVNPADG